MRKLLYFAVSALFAATAVSCLDDNNDIEYVDFKDVPYAYFLCEGQWGKNDASISYLIENASGTLDMKANLYATANGKALGDQANDLIYYGGSLYVVVSGSRYVARLDEKGTELARHAFSEEEGSPRHITVVGGDLYVTLYGGTVVRLDATTLATKQSYTVGDMPEELDVVGDRLLVCNTNYGAGNSISAINTTTGAVQTIETAYNPTEITAAGNGSIGFFKTTSYDASWNAVNTIWSIDATRGYAIDSITQASHILPLDVNTVLFLDQSVDYGTVPYTYTNRFRRLNLQTGIMDELERPFGIDVASLPIYMLSLDWRGGDIYIATNETDASGQPVHSKLYRFGADGTSRGVVDDAGGVFMSCGAYHPLTK